MSQFAPLPSAPSSAPPAADGAPRIGFTAAAAKRVAEILKGEANPDQFLRLSVSGGGCSGFQYGFALDAALSPEDHVVERDGVRLVVDEVSLDLLGGAEVDFDNGLMAQHFVVRNPNAASTCGCGNSFATA
ncbi:MAG: iron-sulfur cluster insertion protein ErpA [Alphaproteobacteria bacterium]|nr:iron-sulfur cluster insertion protein ErpA [Alphaproteobacteria bacterium]